MEKYDFDFMYEEPAEEKPAREPARLTRATKCRYCGKPIAFIKTAAGKSMPVDTEPVEFWPEFLGEKFVTADGSVKSGMRIPERVKTGAEETGYISHFSTCPYADEARKRKNKSERVK